MVRRHRRLWIVLGAGLLGFPCVLYALLPTVGTMYLRSFLSQQGYQVVTLQLGYPGWHTLHIPQFLLRQELTTESLSVTVHNSRLDYDLTSLFAGRLQRLTIAYAAVEWHGRGSDSAAPCQAAPTSPAGPDLFAKLTAGHALQRLPQLPWQELILEQGRLFRACATGPLRDIQVSGSIHQRAAALDGTMTFQGQESGAYRLGLTLTPGPTLAVTLHAEPPSPAPILTLRSQMQRVGAGVQLTGDTAIDVTQFAPFLAFALPLGEAVQHIQGNLQAQWQGTVPATIPLAHAWQHSATSLAGEAALTLRLPKMSGPGDNISIDMRAAISGKVTESTYRLQGSIQESPPVQLAAQDTRWDVQGTLGMDAQHVWGTVGASSSVQVSKAQRSDLALTTATARLTDALSFRADRTSMAWAVGPAQVDIQIPQVSWQGTRVLVKQASLSLDAVSGDALGWQTEGMLMFTGQYEETKVEGLTSRFTLQARGATLSLPEPLKVSIHSLQAGIEVTDITLTIQPFWEPHAALAWVELHDAHAALLGGHLRTTGLRYVPNQPQQTLVVTVEQLDLQQLLQLEQQQSLEGTGTLDGELPIILTPSGVQVQDGKLEARAPGGVLRYHPPQDASAPAVLSETQLALVVQALTNLHYHVLALQVQYAEDGTLRLVARIEGKNPDWQQGRPIHLNLTIQENVPALLQSLQLIQGTSLQQSIYEQLHKR